MTLSFNLFDEYDFASLFPEIKSGKKQLQHDLLLDLIRADFFARSGAGGDTELAKYNVEKVEALAVALQSLTEN
jgi:hypothetical protein